MPVKLFDPFGGFERGPALRGLPLEHPGRFAPLLGMCQAELRQEGHAVDFLHPRRRAEAPNRRRKWVIAASALAALVLLYLVVARVQHYVLACEVEALENEAKTLDTKANLPNTKQTREAAAAIAKWTADDTIWLDKLLALSENFPPAQDAILYELTVSIRQNEAQIGLRGAARNAGIIAKMEEQARAPRRADRPKEQRPGPRRQRLCVAIR